MILVTRSIYCPRCAKRNHPVLRQKFIIYKQSIGKFEVREVLVRSPVAGITPHWVVYDHDIPNQIVATCGIITEGYLGCGFDIAYGKHGIEVSATRTRHFVLEPNEIQALIQTPNFGYRLD
jgi:hypothetical protein